MALQGVVMPSGPLITWTEKRSFTCTAMRCAVVQCTANTVLMCCRAASSVPNTGGQAAPHSSARNKDLQPSCMQLNLLQYSTRNIRGGRAILSSSQWIGAHEAYKPGLVPLVMHHSLRCIVPGHRRLLGAYGPTVHKPSLAK